MTDNTSRIEPSSPYGEQLRSTGTPPMTPEQQTAATTSQSKTAHDNALVEKLTFSLRDWKVGDRVHFPSLNALTIHEAAERIKSLLAEVERLSNEKYELAEHAKEGWGHAHRWRAEYDAAEADRQRMRETLEAILKAPMIDHQDNSRSVYGIARAALNPASKEAK